MCVAKWFGLFYNYTSCFFHELKPVLAPREKELQIPRPKADCDNKTLILACWHKEVDAAQVIYIFPSRYNAR